MSNIPDLSQLSVVELRELQVTIPAEIRKREAQEKKAILNEVRELAKARGYALEDLVGAGAAAGGEGAGAKRPVAPKYRHPQDPSLTWTGRGRKPAWLVQLLEAGSSLEQVAIPS